MRAVFFDAVGTLIHPARPVAETYAEIGGAAVSGAAFRAAFRRQEEIDRAAGWRVDEARERRRWEAVVAEVLPGADCLDRLWHHFADPAAWRLDPDALAVADELRRRGLVVGVASNFDGRLHGVLAGQGWPAGPVVVSSEAGWRKPAAEFYAAVARAAGCPPGEILVVGDDVANDVEGAESAGMRAVLFDPDGRHPARARRVSRLADVVAAG